MQYVITGIKYFTFQRTQIWLAKAMLYAPVAFLATLALLGIEPRKSHKTYRHFTTSKGAFGAHLHPIYLAGVPRPKPVHEVT